MAGKKHFFFSYREGFEMLTEWNFEKWSNNVAFVKVAKHLIIKKMQEMALGTNKKT
jgi:hypothetical protein